MPANARTWPALLLLATLALASGAAATAGTGTGEGAPDNFRVGLQVTLGGTLRDGVAFGVAPTANASYNPGVDRPEAPLPPGNEWVVASFLAPTESFAPYRRQNVSLQEPHGNHSWFLVIEARGQGGSGTVTWSSAEVAVAGERQRLELIDGAQVLDMRTTTSHAFTLEPGHRYHNLTVWLTQLPERANGTPADSERPVITDVGPTGRVGTGRPTLTAAYADNRAVDAARVVLELNGFRVPATATPMGLTFTPAEPLPPGTYLARVLVPDQDGNVALRQWTFTVTDTPTPPAPPAPPSSGGAWDVPAPGPAALLGALAAAGAVARWARRE